MLAGLINMVLVIFFRLIIRFLYIAPVPTTQHAIPRREPTRCFAFWKLSLTEPSHVGRSIADVLMQLNVVVEERKFGRSLLQLGAAADFNVPNRAFERAKKAFYPAVLPGLVWRTALMFYFQLCHRQGEPHRLKSAIVISSEHFWLAKYVNQFSKFLYKLVSTFAGKFKRQQLAAAVIDHTQKRVRFGFDTYICPIQRPGLIRPAVPGWLPQLFAILETIAMFIVGASL